MTKSKVLYTTEVAYGHSIAFEDAKDAVAMLELVNNKAFQLKRIEGYGREARYEVVEPFSSDRKLAGIEPIMREQIVDVAHDTEETTK